MGTAFLHILNKMWPNYFWPYKNSARWMHCLKVGSLFFFFCLFQNSSIFPGRFLFVFTCKRGKYIGNIAYYAKALLNTSHMQAVEFPSGSCMGKQVNIIFSLRLGFHSAWQPPQHTRKMVWVMLSPGRGGSGISNQSIWACVRRKGNIFFTEPRVCNKSIKITLEYITRNPILIPSVWEFII